MPQTHVEFYKPTGKVPLTRFMLLLGASCLVNLILAAFLLFLSQGGGLKGDLIAMLGAVAFPGVAIGLLGKPTRVHQPLQAIFIGIVATLFGCYAYAVLWLWVVTDWQAVILDPHRLWLALHVVAENLQYVDRFTHAITPITESQVNTLFVLHGLTMAASLVISPTIAGFWTSAHPPFCHECGQWMTNAYSYNFEIPPSFVSRVRKRLHAGDLNEVASLKPTAGDRPPFLRADVVRCPICPTGTYLIMFHITPPDAYSNNKPREVRVARPIVIHNDTIDLLKSLATATSSPPPLTA